MVLDADAFKGAFRRKGWTGRSLAARWAKSEEWISKIGSDNERCPHWDDAVAGLPKARSAGDLVRLLPEDFKSLYRSKGWTGRMLSDRWGKSVAWISKVGNDAERAPHWDDAVRGLPVLKPGRKPKRSA